MGKESKTITQVEFNNDVNAAMDWAAKFGPVNIVDQNGIHRMSIVIPKPSLPYHSDIEWLSDIYKTIESDAPAWQKEKTNWYHIYSEIENLISKKLFSYIDHLFQIIDLDKLDSNSMNCFLVSTRNHKEKLHLREDFKHRVYLKLNEKYPV